MNTKRSGHLEYDKKTVLKHLKRIQSMKELAAWSNSLSLEFEDQFNQTWWARGHCLNTCSSVSRDWWHREQPETLLIGKQPVPTQQPQEGLGRTESRQSVMKIRAHYKQNIREISSLSGMYAIPLKTLHKDCESLPWIRDQFQPVSKNLEMLLLLRGISSSLVMLCWHAVSLVIFENLSTTTQIVVPSSGHRSSTQTIHRDTDPWSRGYW